MPDNNEVGHDAIMEAAKSEPFALSLGMNCMEIGEGYAKVGLTVMPEMLNLFGTAHGGVVFSLLDEAFQLACNSHGTVAVALNVSVTYISACGVGDELVAEAREISRTRKTASYDCTVSKGEKQLVAKAQALAYRKGGELEFRASPTS